MQHLERFAYFMRWKERVVNTQVHLHREPSFARKRGHLKLYRQEVCKVNEMKKRKETV
jgi:hypothetical protein